MSDRIVRLRISAPVLLGYLLHLEQGAIVGAGAEIFIGSDEAASVCLLVRHPDAPEGADEMALIYNDRAQRAFDLERIEWLADGKPLVSADD